MKDDEIIAKLLEEITKNWQGCYFELSSLIRKIAKIKEDDYNLLSGTIERIRERIRERIKAEEIAKLLHNDSDVAPNNNSHEIIQRGGYLSYIEAQKKKKQRNNNMKIHNIKWIAGTIVQDGGRIFFLLLQ